MAGAVDVGSIMPVIRAPGGFHRWDRLSCSIIAFVDTSGV